MRSPETGARVGDGDTLLERTLVILERLIAFPSISSASNRDVVDYICAYLSEQGAKVTRLRSPHQDKENVWATFGEGNEGGLVFSGHIDVVPADDEAWIQPPFRLSRIGDRLYGRGTTDMKGFIACVMACAGLFSDGSLRRPIHLAITFDEEVGCFGAKELVDFLSRSRIRPSAVFVGEPTSMCVVDRHKGFVGYTTRIVGKAAHSSAPHLGQNAIKIAADLISVLATIEEDQRSGTRDDAFIYPYPSINIGVIHGGSVRNAVPAQCSFDWEIRPILPAQHMEIRRRFEHLRARKRYAGEGQSEPTIITELINETPPLVGIASEATTLALRFARQNKTRAVSYGTEAGIYQAAGYQAVVCGPGDIQQAHASDEWLDIEQVALCLDFVRALANHAALGAP